jgi:CheY-like chemotaxis protein
MQKISRKVPVIIASGYSKEGKVSQCLESGAKAFLQKPFRKSDLIAAIAAARSGSI